MWPATAIVAAVWCRASIVPYRMPLVRKIVFVNQFRRRSCSAFIVDHRSYSNENRNEDHIKSNYPDISLPRQHLIEYLFDGFRSFSDRVSLQCGLTERKYTFDDVMVKSTNLSKALRKKLNLREGDVVALLLPNIPEFFICAFGSMLGGLKVTTVNPIYTPDEIKRQLLDADVKAIVTLVPFWQLAKASVDLTKNNLHIITIKNTPGESTPTGAIDLQQLVESKIDIPDLEVPSPNETVFIPYSSGTTGLPKGVELTSSNIVSNITQVSQPDFKLVDRDKPTQDVSIAVLPMFHVYGFTTLLALMRDGVKVVTLPKFHPDTYIKSLQNYKPTVLLLVPPIIIFLSSHPGVKSEYLSSLRSITSGAAPLGALDEEKLRQKIGSPLNVIQGYGLSETSPGVTMTPLKQQGKFPGSMGTPLQNTLIKIVDSDGKHVGYNRNGEVWVKGPQVMRGYLNRPDETVNSFHDGWFKTGDLVRCDEHGMVYIVDRMKELIKVKGFQVPPAELEEIIRDFPSVAEAAVIGVPHERDGEVPRAYVISKSNQTIDVDKLQEYVSSKVARHKRLTGGISVIDNLPKNASGKILRKELKELYVKTGV
ncbi:AMP-binding protein [Oryctes borbonicus]|uniref:AMP-binding protein n=1 Tax=Oryctes borbonicus TaxID=1629725 RepID=A0A0T6B776_9SCAR|nr:AMP-binding protein [Oryctes borbonicus]